METLKEEYKAKAVERRKELKELSKIAKKCQTTSCEGMTINEILIEHFYKNEENTEFKTLYDWRKAGFKVIKGSKSFVIWGKPKQIKDKAEKQKKTNEDEEESEFYPICYIFSNAQVQKK